MLSFILFVVAVALIISLIIFLNKKNKIKINDEDKTEIKSSLQKNISFYQKLSEDKKIIFLHRVEKFLNNTKVTAIGDYKITAEDMAYVGASAIIPIWAFEDWEYNNIDEVLLYPANFTSNFDFKSTQANILGMVGNGALNHTMILSLPALKEGFKKNDGHNTGIHEFVHLIDMADGDGNGIPLYLLSKDTISPWMNYMKQTLEEVRDGETDINPYAGKNAAEFFAVIAEYFFEKPEMLEKEHPEIYTLLKKMFTPTLKVKNVS